MCIAEKNWVKEKGHRKPHLKSIFVTERKMFDKMVQQHKRLYWQKLQNDLISDAENNRPEFWRNIGRLGIRDNRKDPIPYEIEDENGNICKEPNKILHKWKTEFCSLLNVDNCTNSDHTCDHDDTNVIADPNENVFTVTEIGKAIMDVRNSRAMGFD